MLSYSIGDGSIIFKDNSFYLNDNFGFNSISYYSEKTGIFAIVA